MNNLRDRFTEAALAYIDAHDAFHARAKIDKVAGSPERRALWRDCCAADDVMRGLREQIRASEAVLS